MEDRPQIEETRGQRVQRATDRAFALAAKLEVADEVKTIYSDGDYTQLELTWPAFLRVFAGREVESEVSGNYERLRIKEGGVKFTCEQRVPSLEAPKTVKLPEVADGTS